LKCHEGDNEQRYNDEISFHGEILLSVSCIVIYYRSL
jgi:hypothetical protein